ncbi:MFS transporter [Allosalinactinospora lopnorensis]|uniref:MFS transporter n=1 Tax=Allosalinactinospora lopnorensis TaxID=1352348 RepID=UPI000623D7A9|nr:MFS transporter [Allosalinactinospora lopnorensis]
MSDSSSAPRPTAAIGIVARLDRLPIGRWHRKLTFIVGIGVFYELFELFLGGVLVAVLTPVWGLTTFEQGALIGSVFLGMFVGANALGALGDRFGRRRMFLVNLTIYLIFGLIAAFSPNVWVLIACRFVAGIGAGAEAALIDAYLGEFLPKRHRGRYVGWALTFGFLAFPAVALLGAPLAAAHVLFFDGWRLLLVAAGSGVVLILWMRRRLPESPRWLAARGRPQEAEAVVAGIEQEVERSTGPLPQPDSTEHIVAPAQQDSFSSMFRGRYLRRVVMMCVLAVLGTVGYYGFGQLAPVLLVSKGFDIVQSLSYTGIIAVGYPLGALLATLIADRMERKTLIVVSALGIAVCGLVFGAATLTWLILVTGFTLTVFSNIFGTASHMYLAEVFPTRTRNVAIGFSYGTGRLAAAVLPFAGLAVLDAFGAMGVLTGSAILLLVCCANVLLLGPRTTGRNLEAITETVAR